ncbi:MAG: hypothetical protein AAF577_02135 [Pseudomonadota bacterium]
MILILVASIAIGLGAAGIVIGGAKLMRLKPPRFLGPVAGGIAMAAFMLWNEYTWFDRAQASLPEGARVAETYEHATWIQPWTLAVPRVTRFAAVSLEGTSNGAGGGTSEVVEDSAELRRGWVVLAARFEGTQRIPVLFDCTTRRRAALTETAQAGIEAGTAPDPATLDWTEGGGSDPLLAAACGPAGSSAETSVQTG